MLDRDTLEHAAESRAPRKCRGEVQPNDACRLSAAGFKTERCAANVSYGCVDADSMWTRKGCLGVFECNGYRVRCGARVRNTSCVCSATSSRLVSSEN